MDSLLAPHRRVLDGAVAVVARVTPDRLDLPTPCAGWDLAALLSHMTAQNDGFAAAAGGLPADPAVWADDAPSAAIRRDPAGAFAASAARVRQAFDDPARAALMDIHGYGRLPARTAVGMHLIDYLVHAWDVARALGEDWPIDADAAEQVLRIAAGWPAGSPVIWGPGAPFAPPVAVPPQAPAGDRVLGLLGRSPRWPEPTPASAR
jgi:uncharacterized protein (TIGR03086 family)